MENSNIITLIRNDTYEVYRFQAISTFMGNLTSNITTFPTTEGTPKTDNIYTNPSSFTINICIGGGENINDEWGTGEDRPRNAMALLKQWREEAVRFTITTPYGDYTNMFLTAISPNSSQTNAYDLNASITFSELFIAKFETVVVGPFESETVSANDSSTQDNGTNIGDKLISAGVGFALGGAIGSFFGGPLGTVLGAGLGGFIAGLMDLFK